MHPTPPASSCWLSPGRNAKPQSAAGIAGNKPARRPTRRAGFFHSGALMKTGTIIDTVLRRNEGNTLTSELILGIAVTLSQVLAQQQTTPDAPVEPVPVAPFSEAR